MRRTARDTEESARMINRRALFMGGAMAAAAFLQHFVTEDRNWAHLDIAGPAFNAKDAYAEVPSGGTGFAVRTLVALAQALAL